MTANEHDPGAFTNKQDNYIVAYTVVCCDVPRSVRGHAHVANEDGCEKQDGTKPLSGAPKVSSYFNVSHLMSAMHVLLCQMTEQRGGV